VLPIPVWGSAAGKLVEEKALVSRVPTRWAPKPPVANKLTSVSFWWREAL